MSQPTSADVTRREIRHMFGIWDIDQFSIIREQEEYVSGGMKRGNGVTVTYFRKGSWQTVFCNHFDYARNMRSIFLFLDRIRIAEKQGIAYQGLSSIKDLVTSSFQGKTDAQESLEDACDVLGVGTDDPPELVRKVYLQKVQFYHPDKGGDPEKFKRINRAYEIIAKAKGIR